MGKWILMLLSASSFTACTRPSDPTPVPYTPSEYALKFGESGESVTERLKIPSKDTVKLDNTIVGAGLFVFGKKAFLEVPLLSMELTFNGGALHQVGVNLGFPNRLGDARYFNSTFGTPSIDRYVHVAEPESFLQNWRGGDRKRKNIPEGQLTESTTVWHKSPLTYIATAKALKVKPEEPELMGPMKVKIVYDADKKVLSEQERNHDDALQIGIAKDSPKK